VSYNCHGFNSFKRGYLQSLLAKCDFLFLQEHWLSNGQLGSLSDISDMHFATAVSDFGHEVLRGSPFGGCAVFWPRSIKASVEVINTHSNRMCAIRIIIIIINIFRVA